MEELAKKFKKRRQELGLSLKQVSKDTNIKLQFIKYIESGNFSQVGPEVYLKGFFKVYSDYLDLDREEILADYSRLKQEEELPEEEKPTSFRSQIVAFIDRHQNRFLLGVIILVLVALLASGIYLGTIVYQQLQGKQVDTELVTKIEGYVDQIKDQIDQEEVATTESTPEDQLAEKEQQGITTDNSSADEVTTEQNTSSANSEETKQVDNQIQKIKVTTTQESWYSVEVDDEIKFRGTVKAGLTKVFTGAKVKLKIGNAAGVKVIKADNTYGPFGQEGEVVTKVFSATAEE
ncbi:helix-turn-helix domain-containing protein [Halanaerobaculum tunisiense]